MEKQPKEPTIEEPIKVNIIKDKKQMRVTIPAQIVEDFRIDPNRYEFAWYVQNWGGNTVSVKGTIIRKIKDAKKKKKQD